MSYLYTIVIAYCGRQSCYSNSFMRMLLLEHYGVTTYKYTDHSVAINTS